jgi:hypothetical protein
MMDFTVAPQEWTRFMWREAISAVVRFGAQPYEDLADVVTAGWILGQRRATLLKHDFWPGVDTICPFTVMTWWPWKPSYATEVRTQIFAKRGEIVKGIDNIAMRVGIKGLEYVIPEDKEHIQRLQYVSPEDQENIHEHFQRLLRVIPEDILTMPISALHERIAQDGGRELTSKLVW